ncbi:hypothetical protein ACYPKM_05400 [Pseudomonas aeruginosa]
MPGSMLDSLEHYKLANEFMETEKKLLDDYIHNIDEYMNDEVKNAEILEQMRKLRAASDYHLIQGKEGLTMEVEVLTDRLLKSIDDANQKIANIKVAGKVITVIADIVGIAGTILESVTEPTKLGSLGEQVATLVEDTKAVRPA